MNSNSTIISIGKIQLNSRDVLIFSILCLSFSISFLIRILPGSYGWELNEFDPFFNFRATEYLIENGINSYFSWNDELSWYPNGRDISSNSQVILHIFTALMYWIFGANSNLYDFTIIFPVVIGSSSTFLIFLLVRTFSGNTTALLSSLLFSISLPIILRGSLGWFKSEPLGLFFGFLATYLFLSGIKSEKSNFKFLRIIFSGISLAFAISAWGGSTFFVIPLGIFIFILPFFDNSKSLTNKLILFSSSLFLSTLLFERPGYNFIFGYLGILISTSTIFSVSIIMVKNSKILTTKKLITISILILTLIFSAFVLLDIFVFDSHYSFRYWNAINPFLTTNNTIVDSIAEHQTTSIETSFTFHTVLLIFSSLGIWLIFSKNQILKKNPLMIFLLIFGILSVFISASYLRLEVFTSISLIIFTSIALSFLIKSLFKSPTCKKRDFISKVIFLIGIMFLLIIPLLITPVSPISTIISTPPTILNGGTSFSISSNDWISTLNWIKNNTEKQSIILSWWDYGYWIQTLGERTTISDNSTLNFKVIEKTAEIFMSEPEQAWKSLREMEVDYLLIFVSATRNPGDFNGETLYFIGGGGDESKKAWIIRIAEKNIEEFIFADGISGTDYFWNQTLLGKLIPFSILGYVNPSTMQDSENYAPGTVGVYIKDVKFSDDDDPLKLVYASPSFESQEPGRVIGVFVYKINENYKPDN